jgi:hypothetical protein
MRIVLLLPVLFLLSACVPPPVDDGSKKAPVVLPKAVKQPPKSSIKLPEKVALLPSGKARHAVGPTAKADLPQGWYLVDGQDVVDKVFYSAELGGVLLSLNKDAGLNVFSAEDAQKHNYYSGMVDGAHLIALPSNEVDKILVIANNRKNARFSIWLKR